MDKSKNLQDKKRSPSKNLQYKITSLRDQTQEIHSKKLLPDWNILKFNSLKSHLQGKNNLWLYISYGSTDKFNQTTNIYISEF